MEGVQVCGEGDSYPQQVLHQGRAVFEKKIHNSPGTIDMAMGQNPSSTPVDTQS